MATKKSFEERVILGIDPGTNIMGYGLIVERNVGHAEMLALGVLELNKFDDHYTRLKVIFDRTISLIEQYHPAELAIEAPFFGKNVQSMLKLGRAQGTAIAAALSRSLAIYEYAPRKIKLAITGQGNASKEQVALLLQRMFSITEMPKNLDATDGLAAAVCHFYQKKPQSDTNAPTAHVAKSWKEFIANNPKRIK
ncbi:MAG: crossover junction endodeoxyribonuclease RuvC [Bacteroidales bacterium]|nr:crossover junction endodeoxyribonuclease RuvC [Bacteroidales bacterium]